MKNSDAQKAIADLVQNNPELGKYLQDFSDQKFKSLVEKYPEEIKKLSQSDEAKEVADFAVGGVPGTQASSVGAAVFVGAEVYVS